MPAHKASELQSLEQFCSYLHVGNKFAQPLEIRSSEAQLYLDYTEGPKDLTLGKANHRKNRGTVN